jgi:hypothetical protein
MPRGAVPGLALALSPANVKDPGGEMSADYELPMVGRPLAAAAHILPPAASAAPADPPWVRIERNVSAFEHFEHRARR